jgi:hypothetical protein
MMALLQEQKKAELVARQKFIDEIPKEVLLLAQINLIKLVTEFQRLSREAKYGDELGDAIAWSKSFGGPNFDSEKLIKIVESARNDFYVDLKHHRKSPRTKLLTHCRSGCSESSNLFVANSMIFNFRELPVGISFGTTPNNCFYSEPSTADNPLGEKQSSISVRLIRAANSLYHYFCEDFLT